MEVKELICICCPMGCPLKVQVENGEVKRVFGNTCKRGDVYARKEVTNPTRIVTSTVTVEGKEAKTVSVKTQSDIPKEKIFACVQELKKVKIKAPVTIGDIVLENVAGTGVNVIATKDVN